MRNRIKFVGLSVLAVILLAAIACGPSATATVPTQPVPTETPVKGSPPPEEPPTVEVPAPIEDSTVVAPENPGGEYILKVTSGLPSGCARFNSYRTSRVGSNYLVDVINVVPAPGDINACTAIYGYHDGQVILDGELTPGQIYTVTVNGKLTNSFTGLDTEDMVMIEKESPIEHVEISEVDGEFVLTVVSRLPIGSSCSRFNGYEIDGQYVERIEVTITHFEVAEGNVPCTEDYPAVVTEIPLAGFEGGRGYRISVNGMALTFPDVLNTTSGDSASNEDTPAGTPSPEKPPLPIEHATIQVPAPIEGSTIVPPTAAGSPYILAITSGLPSGCAKFSAYHLSQEGNDFSVEVTNRVPADGLIACTAIYGYHEGQLTLMDGPLVSDQTYTVTINGEMTHTFTAR